MEKNIKERLQDLKEGFDTELKEVKGNLPSSVWETYSSFANTAGGTIYLGIEKKKNKPNVLTPIKNPDAMIKQIWDCLNNPNLVSKNILHNESIKIIPVKGGSVIAINVPEAKFGDKPIFLKNNLNNTFKRNHEGDYKCTLEEIKQMIREEGSEFDFDSRPNNYGYTFDDIVPEALTSYRELLKFYNPNSFYNNMNDQEFMRATDCLVEQEGKLVLTNGCVLFFSTYEKIMKIYPNYWLDYKEVSSIEDRWDYRITSDDVEKGGNLFLLFKVISEHLLFDLPNRFEIKDTLYNIGGDHLKQAIREALVNCLVNNDYSSKEGINIIKYTRRIEMENGGLIPVGLKQALKGGKSLPRNKQLMILFQRLGVCERAGSGIPFILRTCQEEKMITPNLMEYKTRNTTKIVFNLSPINTENNAKSNELSNVVEILERNPDGTTAIQVSKILRIGYNQARNRLALLVEKGIAKTNNKETRGKLYFLNK